MCSSEVMTAREPPPSTKRSAASTLGPMLPRANCPAAACSRSSAVVTRPSGRADGVPKSTITFGTSVAITRVSASISVARMAAVRSLSMTASTPRSACPSCLSSMTGMPPPPAQTTRKPAAASAWMAGVSRTDSGSGEATTRRQPRSPRSSQIWPSETNRSACSRGRNRPTGFEGSWKCGSSASTRVRVTRPAVRCGRPRASRAASSSSVRVNAIVAWVWATHQSSGTGGTSCAASSFFTSRFPTCGPLPWVRTTSTPAATTSAMCPEATAIASRCAPGVAEPSGPVIALPPRAMTTRRTPRRTTRWTPRSAAGWGALTPKTLVGKCLSGEVLGRGRSPGGCRRVVPAPIAGCTRATWAAPRLSGPFLRSAAPEVEAVPARPEAGRLRHVHREVELMTDRGGGVGVAAEADRLAALLMEPAHLVGRGQRAARVDLQRPAGGRQGPEHRPVLLLVVLLEVPLGAAGPVPAREVDVRQHLEDLAVLDHADELAEVAAHRGVGVGVEQPADPDQPAVEVERVQRAEHAVDRGVAQVGGDARGEQVRLAGLDAGPDPQFREPLAALGDLGEVALDVDRQLVRGVPVHQSLGGRGVVLQPVGEVEVLGEGDRRQALGDRALARLPHRGRVRGVPGPPGVHVIVGRSHCCGLSPVVLRPRAPGRLSVLLPTVVGMSTVAPTSDLTTEALGVLRELTGRPDAVFREGQDAAIAALVERSQRALVVQRTGWGKSAVYFVSTALLRRRGAGLPLLVSPLLGLMRDQVAAAARAGIRAVEISSANMTEWDDIAARLAADDVDVLLVSPERLTNPRFREEQLPGLVARCGLVVVDEAHCVSDWGHDFRPDYRRIRDLLSTLPGGTPVLATTATANERVVADVAEQLGAGGVEVTTVRGPLSRDSLRLGVLRLPSDRARLAWLSAHLGDLPGSGIVYTLTVAAAEETANLLRDAGHEVRAYTGRLDDADRKDAEEALRNNEVKALVATSALGMGFDKPDLGFVVHLGAPSSPVSYYQQVGRAGRAVEHADVLLLPGPEDLAIWQWFATSSMPREDHAAAVLTAMADGRAWSVARLETVADVRR